jgi:hypothetical protein
MSNKNVGITTMVVAVLLAIVGLIYHDKLSTSAVKIIDTIPEVPIEAPAPTFTHSS